MSAGAQDPPTCALCGDITYTLIVLHFQLEEFVNDKSKNKTKLREFFGACNALLNDTGGGVVVYSEKPNVLEQFDQKVDEKLQYMVTDNLLFHQHFERHIHKTETPHHVLFRVKPVSGQNRQVSMYNFYSKVSMNKGLSDPTQNQIKYLVENLTTPLPIEERETHTMLFEEGEPVQVQEGEAHERPFQESSTVQAKAAPLPENDDLSVNKLIKYCLETAKLPEYVSAFSKHPKGGSVYVGVSEHTERETKIWVAATEDEVRNVLQVKDAGYGTWKDEGEDKKDGTPVDVYHVAKESAVPCKKNKEDMVFICEGFPLKVVKQKEFKRKLTSEIKNKIMCLGSSPPNNLVEVQFHPVKKPDRCVLELFHPVKKSDRCVLELRVNTFQGVVFCDPLGPLWYERVGENSYKEVRPKEWTMIEGYKVTKSFAL